VSNDAATSYPDRRRHVGGNIRTLGELQGDVMKAFASLHTAGSAAGALDTKTKELIALAIAVATRCDDCIAFHTHDALKQGATREEIADALGVAVYMGGGPSVMYASHVLDAMEQFEDQSP
jgi:AhpD family alkylhydroperoxidase